MSRAFTKCHLDDGRVLHRFRLEEPHADPHDHPWSFETEILEGGYVEEVFQVRPDGTWHSERLHRLVGQSYRVNAAHIHRIVELDLPRLSREAFVQRDAVRSNCAGLICSSAEWRLTGL